MPQAKQREWKRVLELQIEPLNCRNLIISFMKSIAELLLSTPVVIQITVLRRKKTEQNKTAVRNKDPKTGEIIKNGKRKKIILSGIQLLFKDQAEVLHV